MKKHTFLLIVCLTTISFFTQVKAQKTIQISDMELVNLGDGRYFGHNRDDNKTPINGKVRIITGYTTEYIDAEFAEGLATGKWEHFRNNKLIEVTNYNNGYPSGETITYYGHSGIVKSKTNLVDGKDGTYIRFDSDGNKEYEKSMKNGVEDGPERSYKNGELIAETIFKSGKAEGKSFATINKDYPDCYIKTEFYKNGLQEGEYKEEYCDGESKTTGKYIAGKKDGLWEYFKKDGNRSKPTEGYSNGDLVKKITYYTNGNIDSEKNFKNGREDGVSKTYQQDGTPKSEKNYVNGKQVGKQIQYYYSNRYNYIETSNYSDKGKLEGEFLEVYAETKKPKTKGQYTNSQKDGKWEYYSITGKLEKDEIFDKGVSKSATRYND